MTMLKAIFNKLKSLISKKTTAATIALIASFVYFSKSYGKAPPTVALSAFLLALSQNAIKEVFVTGKNIMFKTTNDTWYAANASMLTKDRLFKLLRNKAGLVFSSSEGELKGLNPFMILMSVLGYYIGYRLYMNYLEGLYQNKSIRENLLSGVRFSDVFGLDQAKQELQEIIDYLKNPQKYKAVGARLRRGVLLYGPSGTGKTLLAKAAAGESNASFLSCTGSEFIELYVGVGPKRVRELFQKARQNAPSIIFIDEIDGIGGARKEGQGQELGSDSERSSTLNQLLAEMDGFREEADIVVIAATNRFQMLDDALIRSGRFDTKIQVDLPNLVERAGIMKIHFRNKKHTVTDEVLEYVAKNTEKYSGADLENIVNESAYICIQHKRDVINDEDLKASYQKLAKQKGFRKDASKIII